TGFFGRQKQNVLRFIADKILFAHPFRVMKKVLAAYGIAPGGSNVFDILIKKSTLSLQSGTPGFEYKRGDISSHVHFVGPLLPVLSKKIKTRWTDERLLQYKKVILVTQGTVENDVTKLLVPTLEAFKNSEYLVIATTGGGQTNELRKQYPQANIIIEDFIAFEDVMPFANVYVTNGGYGGVLLSIKNGLPMVAAGVHEGKNEIAARIGYFKLGLNLKTEKPTAEQIKMAVKEVLEKPDYNNAVKSLATEFDLFNPTQLVTQHIASLLKPAREVRRVKQRAFESEIY
ncbi:MAG: nucleotide disphospho-sugar-binding domain-containing protein, partial [Bacteroidota bacterium]